MVLARDATNVPQKIAELQSLGIPYVIVCGEKVNHPNVVYREANGKWDAINFGAKYIPRTINSHIQPVIFHFTFKPKSKPLQILITKTSRLTKLQQIINTQIRLNQQRLQRIPLILTDNPIILLSIQKHIMFAPQLIHNLPDQTPINLSYGQPNCTHLP